VETVTVVRGRFSGASAHVSILNPLTPTIFQLSFLSKKSKDTTITLLTTEMPPASRYVRASGQPGQGKATTVLTFTWASGERKEAALASY
jgi:hypothetical protein